MQTAVNNFIPLAYSTFGVEWDCGDRISIFGIHVPPPFRIFSIPSFPYTLLLSYTVFYPMNENMDDSASRQLKVSGRGRMEGVQVHSQNENDVCHGHQEN